MDEVTEGVIMSQAHKNALNKYLTTRPKEEIMWLNETGSAYVSNNAYKSHGGDMILKGARRISYGLHGVGGADMIGIQQIEITPDMVGKTIAVFKTVEMKCGRDTLKKDQKKWINIIRGLGGIAKAVYYDGKEFKEI